MRGSVNPVFFPDPSALRAWLEDNHESVEEVWVGLHKKHTRRPSITWPELVDGLLCFGWIDGVRRSLNASSYVIRITPRKPDSTWSKVNTKRAQELIEAGLMTPRGREAFERRDRDTTGRYSFEGGQARLSERLEKAFRANEVAWSFFESQPPGYRKTAITWVMSAKREDTRERRLATLIIDSEKGLRIGILRR
jgi:uncharacterized protein YdeI (YjbR/CyaY-like superfamily)